jgi:hypothetical protein
VSLVKRWISFGGAACVLAQLVRAVDPSNALNVLPAAVIACISYNVTAYISEWRLR